MSDVAYIMETQDPRELWLVEGENKFKVSREMYWLLASKGADLPPTHHITELLTENAKLHDEVERLRSVVSDGADNAREVLAENAKLRDENAELRKLGGFMLRCISQYHDCADCLVNGEHCEISYIEADAREMGIEVDECMGQL